MASYERLERHLSDNDSILIVVLIIPGLKTIGHSINVPAFCVKSMFSLKTHKNIITVICQNTQIAVSKMSSVHTVDSIYNICIEKFLPFKLLPLE